MRKHSTLRSGNPALNSKIFQNLERNNNGPLLRDDVMTIQGTVDNASRAWGEEALRPPKRHRASNGQQNEFRNIARFLNASRGSSLVPSRMG